jgi:glycosyltransferase involved in cell wall biosynthesis
MRASYKLKYNIKRNKELLDYFFLIILKRCNANLFYYQHPLLFWKKLLNNKKVFIANNTVKVIDDKVIFQKRDTILFLGSLIEGKGVLMLIDLYNELVQNNSEFSLKLKIIGGGPLEKKIKEYTQNNNSSNNIQICGPIYDEILLRNHFSSAIMCVSPNQAGLSVLKSMGYGVPFVTSYDAITGGEKYAIQHGINGLFYNTKDELKHIMLNASNSPDKFLTMGINSKKYYTKNATIERMSRGFKSAIEHVLLK